MRSLQPLKHPKQKSDTNGLVKLKETNQIFNKLEALNILSQEFKAGELITDFIKKESGSNRNSSKHTTYNKKVLFEH